MMEFPDGDILYESTVLMDLANILGRSMPYGHHLWPHETVGKDL